MIRHICVRGISQVASLKERVKKRERPSRCCFICSYIPGHFFEPKRTSYWCEQCRKPLCVVTCFKIHHTERDFKKHGQFIREGVMTMEGVDNGD